MDPIHAAHAAVHPLFYDRPGRADDNDVSVFAVDAGIGWESWRTLRDDHWVHWIPVDASLPEQGWKVHVSATPSTARPTLAVVSKYCNQQRLAFKHVRSSSRLMATLAKDSDRASSGKFVTVYPKSEAELRAFLDAIDAVIGGEEGPYILSDLRWRDGPLFVRYGAFQRQTVAHHEAYVPAIRNLDSGHLVPDIREAMFSVPAWVALPDFLQEQLDALGVAPPADFPLISAAVHYSNAGGVYLAERDGVEIILKEARPHAGWTPDGRDAIARLQHEETMLNALPGGTIAPRVLNTYVAHGHHFLALERIPGEALPVLLATRHPLTLCAPRDSDVVSYRDWALTIASRLRAAVAVMHAAGVAHGDLHPGNVMVGPDDKVMLIDFEMAAPAGRESKAVIGVPGFVAKDQLDPIERDL